MARKSRREPDMLAEIESIGDRFSAWMSANRWVILGVVVAILTLAGGYGGYATWRTAQMDAAADALGEALRDFARAMGGDANALALPEPANPEAARRIRSEYLERFEVVAAEHSGTGAATLAAIEAGDLQNELGDREAALATWQGALDGLGPNSLMRALLLERIAWTHEEAERWVEAGEAHEAAGEIRAFPLRYAAFGAAMRCYAEAGERDRALALFERVELEAPDAQLESHVRHRLRELQAAAKR